MLQHQDLSNAKDRHWPNVDVLLIWSVKSVESNRARVSNQNMICLEARSRHHFSSAAILRKTVTF